MKTRQGFVSNSSSSSFVVAIPKVPTSNKEVREGLFFEAGTEMLDMKQLMFGEELTIYGPYDDNQQNPFDTQVIADIVKKDMDEQTPNSVEAIADELSNFDERYGDENVEGMMDDVSATEEYDYASQRNMTDDQRRDYWDERERLSNQRGRVLAEKFLKKNKNCDVYVFSYADEDGDLGSMMEHGDIFRNFKHVRISHH